MDVKLGFLCVFFSGLVADGGTGKLLDQLGLRTLGQLTPRKAGQRRPQVLAPFWRPPGDPLRCGRDSLSALHRHKGSAWRWRGLLPGVPRWKGRNGAERCGAEREPWGSGHRRDTGKRRSRLEASPVRLEGIRLEAISINRLEIRRFERERERVGHVDITYTAHAGDINAEVSGTLQNLDFLVSLGGVLGY